MATPYTPEGYAVLYSETVNAPLDDFMFLTFTTESAYTHFSVARFSERMFYRVVAISPEVLSLQKPHLTSDTRDIPSNWGCIFIGLSD